MDSGQWLSCTVDVPGDTFAAWYIGHSGGSAMVIRQDTKELSAIDVSAPNQSVVLDLDPVA